MSRNAVPALFQAKKGTGWPAAAWVFECAGWLLPWFATCAAILCLAGVYFGFFATKAALPVGPAYSSLYLHLPTAWVSTIIAVTVMALTVTGIAWDTRLPYQIVAALVPTGALLSFIALWSGCLWIKHTWGSWWVWEASLVFQATLWLWFCALMTAIVWIAERDVSEYIVAVLALGGGIAGATNQLAGPMFDQGNAFFLFLPALANEHGLLGLFLLSLGVFAYTLAIGAQRLRCVILEFEVEQLGTLAGRAES